MSGIVKTIALLIVVGYSVSICVAESNAIKIAYIVQEQNVPAALSNLDAFVQHKGMLGAEIAITDNNTTGQFTGQNYELVTIIVPVDGDIVQAFNTKVTGDMAFIVTNLSASQLKRITRLDTAKSKLFFDATTKDDALRNEQCLDNVFHMLPSRAMRADALAQYLMKKRWDKWFLVMGLAEEDLLFAEAIKRSAKRFGMTIVKEKQWFYTFDARRTAQSDVPVFSQGVDYDVLIVADEQGLFGEYLDYRTWIPRPIVGTQGLVPTSWHRTHEQWGAVQIQNRFKELAGRWMDEEDYGAYLAVRAIGEASVRARSIETNVIKAYLLGDEFALQGYKGKPLSFRSWNGQLRQPILLAAARSLITAAPIEGFLHPTTAMDTLGFDQSESSCHHPSTSNKTILPISEANANEGEDWQQTVDKIIKKLKAYIK